MVSRAFPCMVVHWTPVDVTSYLCLVVPRTRQPPCTRTRRTSRSPSCPACLARHRDVWGTILVLGTIHQDIEMMSKKPWFKAQEVGASSSQIPMSVIWDGYVRDRPRDHVSRLCGSELWQGTALQTIYSASPVQGEKQRNISV